MERENRELGIREEGAALCAVQLTAAAPRLRRYSCPSPERTNTRRACARRVAPLCLCRTFITVEAALSRHHRCTSTEPITPLLLRCHYCREGEEMREEGSSQGRKKRLPVPPALSRLISVITASLPPKLPIITVFVRYCCPYPEPLMSLSLLPQKN
ncbi:uncharacterized protein DS421_16g545020 [Arachis hypogaea]|nr:uncharacterized protein DS421_16g545020 [Arachis hypogaea]